VAYRDEQEALRARVEQLEGELGETRRELDRLKGREDTRVDDALARGGVGAALLGGPSTLRFRRRVEGEPSGERMEELVDLLRERFGAVGEIQQGGRGLAWTLGQPASSRIVEVTVVPSGGRTSIRVTERLANLAGGLFGGILGGVGGGGLGAVLPIAMFLAPISAPFAAALWLLTVYGAVRSGYRSTVRRRAAELSRVADELAEAVGGDSGREPVRARVDASQEAVERTEGEVGIAAPSPGRQEGR